MPIRAAFDARDSAASAAKAAPPSPVRPRRWAPCACVSQQPLDLPVVVLAHRPPLTQSGAAQDHAQLTKTAVARDVIPVRRTREHMRVRHGSRRTRGLDLLLL